MRNEILPMSQERQGKINRGHYICPILKYDDRMLPYSFIFLGSLFVDCIPVVAPPAWTLMLFIMMKFDLNPWSVAIVGTAGTVSGRLIYGSMIVPWVGTNTLGVEKEADLKFLGEKLSKHGWSTFAFVFLYSILPLSTTALFTATGLARVKKLYVIPPFFLGNLLGDGAILISGKYAVINFGELYAGSYDLKNILLMLFGLTAMVLFLFIDWREMLTNRNLKMKWQFWK